MKRLIALIFTCLLFLTKAYCQTSSLKNIKIYLGFSAGRAETTFEGTEIDERLNSSYQPDAYLKSRKGLVLTMQSKITFGKYLFLRPSLSYIQKGAEEINATFFLYNFKAELNYLSIPLIIGVQPINFDNVKNLNVYLEGGFVPNFELSRKNDNLTKGYANKPNLQTTIWSYQVGAGMEFRITDKLIIFGNYSYFKDLTPFFEVDKNPTHDAFNKGTTLSLGMMISLKE